ncbi:SAM-dependent methyltransferase [Nocardioides ginsengisegetis]|uniref:SAM-dependent methyltransferase n=1 Tax=Nocardioides ginsengisegetis TaxID=661491 RepID=A0A7W3IZ91_9ACTN|nr:class I SAM-dependent methyltransferase [Nocardioides ginsengisegetis]MBA8803408.1 SAM-dependent methyltransferase [Nocardioides ginsengisegetis]
MGIWAEHVVPRIVEKSCGMKETGPFRDEACVGLTGRVLEIGFGSGHNVDHYPAEVTGVAAVEPSDTGWRLSERRRERSRVPIERSGLDGQALDAADASFDSALSTFSLCTIPDPVQALREVRRVLRPGGTLHFAEHGLSPDERVRRWQHRLEPVQRRVADGCHLTRDIPALVAEAGFEVTDLRTTYLPGPAPSRPFGYVYVGRATRT